MTTISNWLVGATGILILVAAIVLAFEVVPK